MGSHPSLGRVAYGAQGQFALRNQATPEKGPSVVEFLWIKSPRSQKVLCACTIHPRHIKATLTPALKNKK